MFRSEVYAGCFCSFISPFLLRHRQLQRCVPNSALQFTYLFAVGRTVKPRCLYVDSLDVQQAKHVLASQTQAVTPSLTLNSLP